MRHGRGCNDLETERYVPDLFVNSAGEVVAEESLLRKVLFLPVVAAGGRRDGVKIRQGRPHFLSVALACERVGHVTARDVNVILTFLARA